MFRPAWRSLALASRLPPPLARKIPTRLYTTDPEPTKSSSATYIQTTKTFAKVTGLLGLSSAVGILVVGAAILAHDAFTYNEKHVDRVPVNPLALHPERGGPKNLPVARILVDDEEDEEAKLLATKPRLVIVGGGWGVCFVINFIELPKLTRYVIKAMGVLESLHPGDYHVTVVSTDTYTTFTPLLPCESQSISRSILVYSDGLVAAAVGTVSVRSLIEPIRKLLARLRGHFVQGKAVDLVMSERLVEISTVAPDGTNSNFYIPYVSFITFFPVF